MGAHGAAGKRPLAGHRAGPAGTLQRGKGRRVGQWPTMDGAASALGNFPPTLSLSQSLSLSRYVDNRLTAGCYP
jgi:hypothetical protein